MKHYQIIPQNIVPNTELNIVRNTSEYRTKYTLVTNKAQCSPIVSGGTAPSTSWSCGGRFWESPSGVSPGRISSFSTRSVTSSGELWCSSSSGVDSGLLGGVGVTRDRDTTWGKSSLCWQWLSSVISWDIRHVSTVCNMYVCMYNLYVPCFEKDTPLNN